MKSLGIFLFESYGSCLKATNEVFRISDLKVLESTPLGSQGLLMASGPVRELQKLRGSPGIIQDQVLKDIDPRVWEAYLSLTNSELSNIVVVAESGFIGDLFKLADSFLKNGFQIVDLRLPRTAQPGCYLITTGSEKLDLKELAIGASVKVQEITSLTPEFRDFFSLKPLA